MGTDGDADSGSGRGAGRDPRGDAITRCGFGRWAPRSLLCEIAVRRRPRGWAVCALGGAGSQAVKAALRNATQTLDPCGPAASDPFTLKYRQVFARKGFGSPGRQCPSYPRATQERAISQPDV